MIIIRSNLETYLYMALQVTREADSRAGANFKSGHTATIEETLKAVQAGEQLEIIY